MKGFFSGVVGRDGGGVVATLAVVAACALSAGATPVATDVGLSDEPNEGIVFSYQLSEEAIVTVEFLTNGVPLDASACTEVGGDVNKVVAAGARRLTWRPDRTPAARAYAAGELSARLTVWPKTNPPDYLCVDLASSNSVTYYASSNAVPKGVTDRQYKTTKLLMRRIPAGGVEWRMGPAQDNDSENNSCSYGHYVKLSDDYYMAVYELTLRQAWMINDYSTSHFSAKVPDKWVLPMEGVSWQKMRGNKNWPADGHAVGESCLLQRLRDWCGLELDLPTDAQWEFACRAGTETTTYWGDDKDDATVKARVNTGSAHTSPIEVGSYPPNPWGLYDMYGNLGEFCLDYGAWGTNYKKGAYNEQPTVAIENPKGPTQGLCNQKVGDACVRVGCGGGYSDATKSARSWRKSLTNVHESNDSQYAGWRLVCPLPFK